MVIVSNESFNPKHQLIIKKRKSIRHTENYEKRKTERIYFRSWRKDSANESNRADYDLK